MKFEEYFSFEAIVGDLIRWRLRGKGTRGENGRTDVEEVLPPRRMWNRAGVKERKGVDSAVIRKQSILRTILRYRESKSSLPPHLYKCGGNWNRVRPAEELKNEVWGRKLLALVKEVQTAVFSGTVAFETPKMFEIEKGRENGVKKVRRVASFERLLDRVILSRMTAYVRDVLEPSLTEHCYSFRSDPSISHQLAVARLQEWRWAMTARPESAPYRAAPMFVAECDIVKFFDSISHDVVRRCWDGMGFDARAGKVLEAYLGVYAADGADAQKRVPPSVARRGLPQGGSLSTVLANLVLRVADAAVQKVDDGQLFYARFCDDVVFAHPSEEGCRRAMEAYAVALRGLDLPLHPVEDFVYRPADGSTTEYYSIKSKGPFRWRAAEVGERGCAPWVSFLGSQIRYDGETRIRKESIEKHIRSLGRETAAAVREIKDGKVGGAPGAARPTVMSWFARFRNRLIAKGVGYVTAKVQDCGMCWAGAFPNVTACADTKMQMRRLDRVREGMLCKVWRMVCGAVATDAPILSRRSRGDRPTRRYKGRPFSYFGFLEKAVRPTNMAWRRVRTRALPYSEL